MSAARASETLRASVTALGVALLVVTVPSGDASAQVARVGAEVGVSRAFPPAGSPSSAATYLEGGGDVSVPVGVGQLFGSVRGGWSLTEETSGDWVTGSVGGHWLAPVGGGLSAGGTVLGQAFYVAQPTRYSAVSGRIFPELRWRSEPVTISLRGRGAVGRATTAVQTSERPGPPGPGGTPTRSLVTSDLSHLGGEARVQLTGEPGRVWVSGRSLEADRGTYEAAEVGAVVETGRLQWSGRVAYWDTPGGEEWTGGLEVSLPVGGGWTASTAGGRRAPDPLLATPAAADLSATLRRGFTFPWNVPPAIYEVGPRSESGARTVVFRLQRPDAERVAVVGGFSNWEPVPMEREGDVWTARLSVGPGVYHFGFRVDGAWVVPDRAPGVVSDGWGRENATLVVPGRDASRTGGV